MKAEAVLTYGWPETTDGLSAMNVHQKAMQSENYGEVLQQELSEVGDRVHIQGLGRLFRRRAGAYGALRRFVGELISLPSSTDKAIPCEIDIFSYAFVKGAKNFDFILPEIKPHQGPFRSVQPSWIEQVDALEELERLGEPIPEQIDVDVERYFKLRAILTRGTAYDERKALATLLISGPSSLEQIEDDLGMNVSLSQRAVTVFCQIGVVECDSEYGIYRIRTDALPMAIFCIRELLGVDPLSVVGGGN